MCSIWKSCSADVLVYIPHRYRYQSNAPNKMLRSFWMLLQQAVSMFYFWFIFVVMEQGSFIHSLQDGRCSLEGYRIRESSKSPDSMGWNVKADLRAFCAVSKAPSGFYLLSYWEKSNFSWSVEIKVWCIVKTYCYHEELPPWSKKRFSVQSSKMLSILFMWWHWKCFLENYQNFCWIVL